MKKSMIFKILNIGIIFLYISFFPITYSSNIFDSLLVLFFSIGLIIKSRKNLFLLIIMIFIFYSNYSIVVGEYLFVAQLGVPMTEVRTIEIYGLSIRIMLLFMSIIFIFYEGKKISLRNNAIIPNENDISFILCFILLVLMFIFGINRGNRSAYTVRISPLFEYSKFVFIFLYYFSGNSKMKKILGLALLLVFVIQDAFYGGRITSMQLLIMCAITYYSKKLTFKKVLIFAFFGIFLNVFVGSIRHYASLDVFDFGKMIENLFAGLFVFDTATFAYYASATHVAAVDVFSISIRLQSLFQFIITLLTGYIQGFTKSDVTLFVQREAFFNFGGGLLPTHFFFWLGWIGVIIIALIVVALFNWEWDKSETSKLFFLAFVISVPRWYLYSPNQLFRGTFIMMFFLIICFRIFRSLISKNIIITDKGEYEECQIKNKPT